MTFICPLCRKVGVESNSIEADAEGYKLARICRPCANAIQRAVEIVIEEAAYGSSTEE